MRNTKQSTQGTPLKKQLTIKAVPNKIFDNYRLSRGKVDITRYFLDPDELRRHEAKLLKQKQRGRNTFYR